VDGCGEDFVAFNLYTDNVGVAQNEEFLNIRDVPVPPGSPVGTNTTVPHDGVFGLDTVPLDPDSIFGNYTTWFRVFALKTVFRIADSV
jgi:hypothetical protein